MQARIGETCKHLLRIVCGPIIDDDDFEFLETLLLKYALQAFRQIAPVVV